MDNKKEIRGIYNTTFNDKNATPILKEIEAVENAIQGLVKQAVIAMYVKGYHNIRKDSGTGAEHIKMHLNEKDEGAISVEELLNLGNSLREYLKIFKEPLIEQSNNREDRKIYEWENKERVRFRCVVREAREEGPDVPLSFPSDQIITFYSDRNLNAERGKTRMQFKNPQVEAYYKQQEQQAMIQKKEANSKDRDVSKDKDLEI